MVVFDLQLKFRGRSPETVTAERQSRPHFTELLQLVGIGVVKKLF